VIARGVHLGSPRQEEQAQLPHRYELLIPSGKPIPPTAAKVSGCPTLDFARIGISPLATRVKRKVAKSRFCVATLRLFAARCGSARGVAPLRCSTSSCELAQRSASARHVHTRSGSTLRLGAARPHARCSNATSHPRTCTRSLRRCLASPAHVRACVVASLHAARARAHMSRSVATRRPSTCARPAKRCRAAPVSTRSSCGALPRRSAALLRSSETLPHSGAGAVRGRRRIAASSSWKCPGGTERCGTKAIELRARLRSLERVEIVARRFCVAPAILPARLFPPLSRSLHFHHDARLRAETNQVIER
jgi:hypothetical protein